VSTSEDGWNGLSHGHWLILITLLAAFALFFLQAMRRSPAIPVTLSAIVTILAGLSTIWIIIRVPIDPPAGRDFGGWLALISSIALTWGGYESLRTEGIDPQDGPGEIPALKVEDIAGQRASQPETHS
jgi:hypothetical protein